MLRLRSKGLCGLDLDLPEYPLAEPRPQAFKSKTWLICKEVARPRYLEGVALLARVDASDSLKVTQEINLLNPVHFKTGLRH